MDKQAPSFLTIQVSRNILNEAIRNLNAYAAPRVKSPSELLLTAEEISAIIDQGDLSRTLLLSAAHLKRVEVGQYFASSCLPSPAPTPLRHAVSGALASFALVCALLVP